MTAIPFVTANRGKHREVERLLAGVEIRWERLDLARPESDDLEAIARSRASEAYGRLGEPCFLENTGLYLYDHEGRPGSSFKREWRALGEEGFAAKYGGAEGVARVVVAYAACECVYTFQGSIAGRVLRSPRGSGGYGWDRLWVPDGYERTLGEMSESSYAINMRAAPYLELADFFRGKRTSGSFEAHLTVSADADLERFRVACDELGVKCITVDLPAGAAPLQPMTGSFHRGELLDVQREVNALAQSLVRRGFVVKRTKIEQHGRLLGAPETDQEARRAPKTAYFEFHVKIAIAPDRDLRAVYAAAGGHLSRNARKGPGADGLVERFVTMRLPGIGRHSAETKFAALCDVIERSGVAIRSRIREYTVFDTNLELDAGWLS